MLRARPWTTLALAGSGRGGRCGSRQLHLRLAVGLAGFYFILSGLNLPRLGVALLAFIVARVLLTRRLVARHRRGHAVIATGLVAVVRD